MWIFWMHSNTQARVLENFSSIANTVKLRGRRRPDANIPQLVCDWLSNPQNGKWFLILDSADDPDVFFHPVSKDEEGRNLAEYLPQSLSGSILITTRNKDLALRLVDIHDQIHHIGPMTEPESLTLFQNRLGTLADASDTSELVASLDFVPLAISQAAAYIQRRSPRTSVAKYLADFRRSERKRVELLNEDSGDLRRDLRQDGAASNSILATWQFSFDHIRTKRPSATDLLSLMSFFNRQGIPESILLSAKHSQNADPTPDLDDSSECICERHFDSESDSQASNEEFETDIEILRNYSLISQSDEASLFEMHELVQLATRRWLKSQGLQERFLWMFLTSLASAFPTPEHSNRVLCEELFPHVEAAALYQPNEHRSKAVWSAILEKGATYAFDRDQFSVAEKMALLSMNTRQSLFGESHRATLNSMVCLSAIYDEQWRWEEADDLCHQIFQALDSRPGTNDERTLFKMLCLARISNAQGRFIEAERVSLKVMECSTELFGPDHDCALFGMHVLASSYRLQNRWEDAEKLDKQVFERLKKARGLDDSNTLLSMSNLMKDNLELGRLEDAEELGKLLVQRRGIMLGANHSSTLQAMSYLAITYFKKGRLEEAEKIHLEVIELHEKKFVSDVGSEASSKSGRSIPWLLMRTLAGDPAQKFGAQTARLIPENNSHLDSTLQALKWLKECLLSKDCFESCTHTTGDHLWADLSKTRGVGDEPKSVSLLQKHDNSQEEKEVQRLQLCKDIQFLHERKTSDSKFFEEERAARLVEIIDTGGDTKLKLVPGSAECTPYAALSYRWGGLDAVWQTSTKNLDTRLEGFDIDALPKTLSETVQVVRDLGLRWIWIDSLCIVQDDKHDWAREAIKMATIYQNALVTIAADSSEDARAGLHNEISSSMLNENDGFKICSKLSTNEESSIFLFPYQKTRLDQSITSIRDMGDLLSHSSLRDRGWTMQERILSSRIIHYASDQLYWECYHGIQESEDELLWIGRNINIPKFAHRIKSAKDDKAKEKEVKSLLRYWYVHLVGGDYSHRSLTFRDDKLLAISGVAKALENIHPLGYMAGHWCEDDDELVKSLCWKRGGPGKKSAKYRAPSWSWASQDSAINYGYFDIVGTGDETIVAEPVAMGGGSPDGTPFGRYGNGYLEIKVK
ncbi:hypothetical protein IL306_002800, partial [Fusarium sp. DS 682]